MVRGKVPGTLVRTFASFSRAFRVISVMFGLVGPDYYVFQQSFGEVLLPFGCWVWLFWLTMGHPVKSPPILCKTKNFEPFSCGRSR